MARRLPLSELRPTQLYLSSEKLAGMLEWFDVDDPNYEPLPVFEHDGAWYLSDGHTRAFATALAGAETIRVERDRTVLEEFDFDAYLTCIDWCAAAGVETVRDLHGRVVGPETYEREWVQRCQRFAERSDE
ncbi:histone acetyltransferase [Natronobeatus ordinarius]|uniref:histone acetyltransferase n=1 Tax=Natronobeatus ordinarius TaxID=2963433 RepID=UPI0020CD2697|nr:histone acetyltransferase [Natronobeatus ordinarius]